MDVSGLLLHAADFSTAQSTKAAALRLVKTSIAIALGRRATITNGWSPNPQEILGQSRLIAESLEPR